MKMYVSVYEAAPGPIFRVMTGISLQGAPFDGLRVNGSWLAGAWIPAYAGMTVWVGGVGDSRIAPAGDWMGVIS